MCYNLFKVRSCSKNAPVYQFVPCGYCEECRNSQRSAWSVRLALDMSAAQKRGCKLVFGTLTYSDEFIPRFPNTECPCFSRTDATNFIHNVRKWLHRNYGVTDLRYMLCCDIGKNTYRPHYHFMMAFPECFELCDGADSSASPILSAQSLHDYIKRIWTKGFVFPRHYLGGRDCKGYEHKAFELVSDAVTASFYTAKYCAKSIVLYQLFKDFSCDLTRDDRREYDCFHLQSRSLGLAYIKDLTDEQKRELLKNGVSFVGQYKTFSLPHYFKNKIMFDPLYILRADGSRLVRRSLTSFFEKYYEEIYEDKVRFYEHLAADYCNLDALKAKGVPTDNPEYRVTAYLLELRSKSGLTLHELAQRYVSYFGLPSNRCFKVGYPEQWFARYFPSRLPCCSPFTSSDYLDLMPSMHFWSMLLDTLSNYHGIDVDALLERDRLRDFYSSYCEDICSESDKVLS